MYGHKNRTLGVDYCFMPMDALSSSIVTSPSPQPAPSPLSSSPDSAPGDWILKKEKVFLLAQFWQQRATLAEKEVTSLKEQLAKPGGSSFSTLGAATMAPPPDRDDPVISTSQNESQDFEMSAKDKEIAALVESVQRLQSSLNQMRESSAAQIRLLEEQLDQKQELISRLEKCLDQQRDYEEVKRELEGLKNMSSNNNSSPVESLVNGNDAKESRDRDRDRDRDIVVKKERAGSPPVNPINPRFLLGPSALPVEAFGSLLSEELVASWRKSLERSLLGSSLPLHLHTNSGSGVVGGSQVGNDSSSPPPQQPSPNDSGSLHDSSLNMEGGMLNGSGAGERLPYRFEDSLIPKSDPMEGKLQEMLRYNMDKFGSQCLDTLGIARRVRELLSIHNIGQRLFAKYILGLSQGTVSELLSKPKPWDKLTEKGRDSYRKMHAWAADDAAVFLLKSLIPKKGKEGTPGSLSSSFRCEDSGAEDRIAHILSEANQALHPNHHERERIGSSIGNQDFSCDDNPGSKSPISLSNNNNNINSINNNNGPTGSGICPPSPSGSSGRDRRLRKYENDDISQEQVSRIYQEELAKLVGLRLPPGGEMDPRIPREHFQSLLFPHLFGSSLLERDDVRMALDAYHRELAKLASSASPSHFPPPMFHPGLPMPNGLGGAQDLTMPKRLSPADSKDSDDKYDKEESIGSVNGSDVLRHVGSAFSLVRPKTESSSGAASPLNSILPPSGGDDSSNASPLQRMASITNSLISQPPTPAVSSPNQRPLKAVLPPITQQQFDQYNNLNTEDIVRRVKEQLSQYSISQRLFGESVLGLSQGSVSDLLARPKPWHMLTQKGREPFIRMKMFLEDENAVHKLVASQYKIAPEKLMRTGGYAGNPSPASISKAPVKTELPKSHETSPLPPPPIPQAAVHSPVNHGIGHDLVKKASSVSQGPTAPSPVMLSRPMSSSLPQQPSVYEMAALTQDLDTQLITTKIKEALLANNIGQKIFGEVVLGLSQGSVSELLSKPKPWHMLSIKGREPFIRMQLWLADPLNVERLQQLKNERREATKRKRGLPHNTSSMDAYTSGAQGSSDASNDSPNESFSPGSSAAAPPNKKQRVLFSDEQKEALRLAFALDPYPNVSAIEFLAKELGLSSRTITNWFHNHRMRLKQQTSSPLVQESSLSSQPFDPVQFRVLLHQRLIEMHKDKFPVLPFLNAAAMHHRMEGGLDLTVGNVTSRGHSDNDEDYFEEEDDEDMEGSIASDDSGNSEGSKNRRKRKSPPKSISSQLLAFGGSQGRGSSGGGGINSGSSRRKPSAPQWFNPSWHDDSDDDDVVINGVCVLQGSKGKPEGNGTSKRNARSGTPPLELRGGKASVGSDDEDDVSRNRSDDDDGRDDLMNDRGSGDEEDLKKFRIKSMMKTNGDSGEKEDIGSDEESAD